MSAESPFDGEDRIFLAEYPALYKRERAENAALLDLIRHIDIHSAYPHNGYGEMTTEQKALYRQVRP